MARLLDPYFDPVLEVDAAAAWEDLVAIEIVTLQAVVATIAITASIPRRLGGDASRDELALDKRRSKRVLHIERQSLLIWGGKERVATDEEHSAGAQLAWEEWHELQRAHRQARLRYIATWAKRTGQLRYGRSGVVRIAQELEWLDYALRD